MELSLIFVYNFVMSQELLFNSLNQIHINLAVKQCDSVITIPSHYLSLYAIVPVLAENKRSLHDQEFHILILEL